LVDDRGLGVLLLLGRDPLGLLEDDLSLLPGSLLRPRNGRQERCAPSPVNDVVRRLPVVLQVPMLARVLVRRIEDRVFEEAGVGHAGDGKFYPVAIFAKRTDRPGQATTFVLPRLK